MAQEVGIAYVTVAPSAKGFGKAVEGEIAAGVAGASKSSGGRLRSLATSVVKWGTAAVVGVGAAITGLALKGGISRALNIEDAQAKLRGLGHDTKAVEAIMTDALASVRGTAFGLDTAATVAATAVAAGIKPGQELEKYLRLTADAATIAGVSMEEMGSILNKTTTSGKVFTQELNQLADRGLPIFQWLQEEYGVTAEELRKMVAAGEVDAETFRKVIEENIGGAALASGDTTRGAFANMRAAMSRFGVALLGDGLGSAKTFFNEMIVIFDGLTERIGPAVDWVQEKLGGMFQIDGMGDRFLGFLDSVTGKLSGVGNVLSHFTPFGAALKTLQPLLPPLAEAFKSIGSVLSEQLKDVLPILAQTFADVGVALMPLVPMLADFVMIALDLLEPLLTLITPLAELASVVLPPLVSVLVWLIESGLTPTKQALEALAVAFEIIAPLISGFIDWLIQGQERVDGFWAAVAVAWEQLRASTTEVFEWIGGFLAGIWEQIGLMLGGALKMIVGLFTGNFGLVREGLLQFSAAARQIWENVVSFFREGALKAANLVLGLKTKIADGVKNASTWLVQTGKDIIQGMINGIASMVNKAVNAVKNVGGKMLDSVKDFLGIKSPSRVFRDQVGKMVGLGLLEGVEDQAISGRIDSAVSHLVEVPSLVGASSAGDGVATFNLFDENGTLWATFKGALADVMQPVSAPSVLSQFGT